MPRYKLTVEYDGGPYVGWQRQNTGPTIQAALEYVIQAFSGERVTVEGAGRTDAGVHATGQVAHVDLSTDRFTALKLMGAINALLKPQPIAIRDAEIVSERFHARFSAVERAYRYVIINRLAPLAIGQGRAWHVSTPLDSTAMAAAAARLVGHHDFTTFRATHCQAKSAIKTLDHMSVEQDAERILILTRARSFLHHQVRNIVGTLRLVGEGKWTPDDVTTALEARNRAAGGPTAPADGLYLTGVRYDAS